MRHDIQEDRVLGGLFGLLVGDALGVPYEFSRPESLPRTDLIEMDPPTGFRRAHPSAPRAAWSDDGSQALCLLASLLHCSRLDLDDFGRRLVNWWNRGYLAVDNVVFDVGNQTSVALAAIRRGSPPELAGCTGESHNGNGSLMRVLPLALWHPGTTSEVVRDSARQSVVTHAHVRSQVCCALYSLWARATLEGHSDPWQHATASIREHCSANSAWEQELEKHIKPDAAAAGQGTGYVVDCLHSARFALLESTFERVVQRAVSLGNDTDTTAAVAGGIAGLRHGLTGIPERWLSALAGRHLVDPLASQLIGSLRERTSKPRST